MALWISTSWDIIYQTTISSGKYKPILNACSFVSNWAKIVEMLFVPRVKVFWYIMISSSWFMHRSKIYFCHFRCLLGTASPTCIITQYAPSLTSMVQLNPLYNCVCIFFSLFKPGRPEWKLQTINQNVCTDNLHVNLATLEEDKVTQGLLL